MKDTIQAGQGGQHDGGAPNPKEVTVTIDGTPKTIEMGKYTPEQLATLLGVAAGYVISVKDGESPLKPLTAGQPYQVHPGMQFFSQPPDGSWS